MGALDGFYSTWNNARETFGQGTPQGGAEYDGSAPLRRMADDLEQAAPGSKWSGAAAGAYERANNEHREVFGKLAELDRRLGAYVDQSADVVRAGRSNLDTVRQWVTDAAGSVPPGKQRDAMLMQIASRGLSQLSEVVSTTNAESNAVAQRLGALKAEYEQLASKQRFGGAKEDIQLVSNEEQLDEQDEPTKTDMSSGDIEAVDRANREMLQDMLEEYQQLPDGQVKQDRLADIAAIQEALKTPESYLLYLERPSDPSQMIPAATSVGDPFKADHVSVTVPGVSSTTRGALASMTGEAAQLRAEAQDVAVEAKESTNIATVSWTGYQPPPSVFDSSALTDDLAQEGAPKLTSFLQQLDSASQNPNQTTSLFGHSYGSLTAGIALGDGANKYVDNAVMYGSPGFQAWSTADLGMRDDNFFVMNTPTDLINPIADLAPLHGWGASPNDVISEDGGLRFRFPHLETDAGVTPLENYEAKTGASDHADYPREAEQRMTGYNLAAILLDRPDLAVHETPKTW